MKIREIINRNRNIFLILIDICIMVVVYLVSMLFLDIKIENFINFGKEMLLVIITYEIFLNLFHMYQNLMRYEVGKDYVNYIISSILSVILLSLMDVSLQLKYINPKLNILSGIMIAGMFVMYRLAGRSIITRIIAKKEEENQNIEKRKIKNLLIIGAGMGGREIVIAVKNSMRNKYNIVGIIDDDKSKLNHYILGVKVLGTRYDIPKVVSENDVDIIFFAINRIDAASRKKIIEICQETEVKTRVLPTTEEVIDKQGAINSLRDIEIEDLLGREAIQLDNKNIHSLIKNKNVLVTGGGGSIGSELCRQIIKYEPKKLIILDIYENNLYDIEVELKSAYPKADIDAVVASVRDKARLKEVFEEYKPQIVFHAAAHKHVP